jgi:hypothetical protein
MQDGETFTPQSVQFLPRFSFITHTGGNLRSCDFGFEYLFLFFKAAKQLHQPFFNPFPRFALQLKCAFVTRCRAHRKAYIGLFSFCSFYNVRLLFNAPCSFDRKVIGSEEEKEKLSSHCPTHTHLKIVQCKKATELFISSNTLLQIVKSLKNVAYLVFVMI